MKTSERKLSSTPAAATEEAAASLDCIATEYSNWKRVNLIK